MGGLALLARATGHTVSGCDANVYPPMSTQLADQGIRLIEGYDAAQTKLEPDLFVIGNVVTRGNPLMEAILNENLAYISGPQWLAQYILRENGCWPWQERTAKPRPALCWRGYLNMRTCTRIFD